MGAYAEYLDQRVLGPGLVWLNRARIDGQFYRTEQDPAFPTERARLSAALSTQASMPLARTGPGGAHHLIEPIAALTLAEQSAADVPNEDSVIVEFDEGNLFALSRFPGDDAIETGLRADLALRYTGVFGGGTGVGLTVGRIVRAEESGDFAEATGLSGRNSDWLAAARVDFGTAFGFTGRMLLDDAFEPRQTETRVTYRQGPLSVTGSYNWIEAEPLENQLEDIEEVKLATALRLGRHWRAGISGRYDFTENESAQAGLVLNYRTECIRVGMTLSRKFTDTETIRPATTFNFGLELVGFGADATDETYRRTCRG